jgi:hypothetical protein
MPTSNKKSSPSPPKRNLEEWLQLPDSYASGEHENSIKLDEFDLSKHTEGDISDTDEPEIIVLSRSATGVKPEEISEAASIPEEPVEEMVEIIDATVEKEEVVEVIEVIVESETPENLLFIDTPQPTADDTILSGQNKNFILPEILEDSRAEEIDALEDILKKEFSDTLSSVNAQTIVWGIIFLLVALAVWFIEPVMSIIGISGLNDRFLITSKIIGVILFLAGIHLTFYWSIHKISNTIKTRELDKILEARRVTSPCIYLDCKDSAELDFSREAQPNKISTSDSIEDLPWRCSLYEVDLDESPICAICEKYEFHKPEI